ncbi:hypothetical protein TNCV_4424771 [Trichonephila clavipes]|nr:hypothetical protein TNCV_4424771 [Trichonephila clavipes]
MIVVSETAVGERESLECWRGFDKVSVFWKRVYCLRGERCWIAGEAVTEEESPLFCLARSSKTVSGEEIKNVDERVATGVVWEKENSDLHVFVDASKEAYTACIFVRTKLASGIKLHLLRAKARVAPTKSVSMPRDFNSCHSITQNVVARNLESELAWDSPLPLGLCNKFDKWFKEILLLQNLEIPRYCETNSDSDLHVIVDASNRLMLPASLLGLN